MQSSKLKVIVEYGGKTYIYIVNHLRDAFEDILYSFDDNDTFMRSEIERMDTQTLAQNVSFLPIEVKVEKY